MKNFIYLCLLFLSLSIETSLCKASTDKPDIPCTQNLHLFIQGSWIKVSYQEQIQKQITSKLEKIQSLVSQDAEKPVQIKMLRPDGFEMLFSGVLKKDTEKGLYIWDSLSNQKRFVSETQIAEIDSLTDWQLKFGLLKTKAEDNPYILGKIIFVNLETGYVDIFNTETQRRKKVAFSEIDSFLNLSEFRGLKSPLVKKALFYKKVRYENSVHVAEMDLELVEWDRGSLVFSSPDSPNEFFEVRISDLENFLIKN